MIEIVGVGAGPYDKGRQGQPAEPPLEKFNRRVVATAIQESRSQFAGLVDDLLDRQIRPLFR